MSTTTRVNGSYGNYSQGTLRTVYQLKAFIIDAGASLADQDADGAGEVDQALEAVIREVQPLMYYSATDKIHVIVDGHAVDAASLEDRIQALGTVNGYDLSGATVTLGTSITVA